MHAVQVLLHVHFKCLQVGTTRSVATLCNQSSGLPRTSGRDVTQIQGHRTSRKGSLALSGVRALCLVNFTLLTFLYYAARSSTLANPCAASSGGRSSIVRCGSVIQNKIARQQKNGVVAQQIR